MNRVVLRALTAVLAIAVPLSLVGCSALPRLELDRERTSQAPVPTAEAPTEEVAPLITGMSLSGATDYLASKNLTLTAVDASAAKRELERPELWLVISQDPAAGEAAMSDEAVRVEVVKRDETQHSSELLANPSAMASRNRLMLDLVGMNLAEARDAADENDLLILDEEDATGDDRSVWLASNWVVVAQDVAPGAWETTVTLQVVKEGEVADVSVPMTADPHWNETTFVGVVTGHDEGSWGSDGSVMVDGAEVELDLVSPFGNRCLDPVDDSAAFTERDRLLPVGTRVLVERTSLSNDLGFIHLEEQFDPADRFSNSVNEQLVRSGYWVPDGIAVINSKPAPTGEPVFYDLNTAPGYLNPVQALYAPRIIEAGNGVLAVPVGGMVECATQAVATQAEFAARKADSDARMREWELEYQRKLAAGYYSCRDGDGDGVCHER